MKLISIKMIIPLYFHPFHLCVSFLIISWTYPYPRPPRPTTPTPTPTVGLNRETHDWLKKKKIPRTICWARLLKRQKMQQVHSFTFFYFLLFSFIFFYFLSFIISSCLYYVFIFYSII